MHLYFICTGNTCRSPMAQRIMREKMPYAIVESRGLSDNIMLMSEGTAQVLWERFSCGSFIVNHLSRQVDSVDVMLSDIMVTMEQRQRDMLHTRYPVFSYKIRTLGDILDEPEYEVLDPLNDPRMIQRYRDLFDELDERLSNMAHRLRRYEDLWKK